MMRWRTMALAVAILAMLLFAVAGPGSRLGLWEFGTGFKLLQWGAYAGMLGVVLSLVALVVPASRRAGLAVPLVALALATIPVLLPWRMREQARSVPPIHDITTDVTDPPAFVAVLPLREASKARNPTTYGGDSIARQQQAAYPDVRPLDLAEPPAQAFARALEAARAMGWVIVAADTAAARIEATATTRWFGFQDDVVIRVRPNGAGSRVDVRSLSRIGGSDVGANAARIRAYLARLGGG